MGNNSTTKSRWIKSLILIIFAGGFIGFFAGGGAEWLDFGTLKDRRDWLLGYSESHYWIMLVATAAVYTAVVAFSIPAGAAVLSLTTGFVFGRWVGTVIIVFSATLGATIVFLAARYLFAEFTQRRMDKGVAKRIMEGFNENAFNYLMFLRLVPVFPFWLINLVTAFTHVSLRTYVLVTAVGIIPGSFVYANLGQSLGRINSPNELLSWEIVGAFLLLGVFALVPVFIKQYRSRKAQREALNGSS